MRDFDSECLCKHIIMKTQRITQGSHSTSALRETGAGCRLYEAFPGSQIGQTHLQGESAVGCNPINEQL